MKNKQSYKKQTSPKHSLIEYILLSFVPLTTQNRDLLYHRDKFIKKISQSTNSSSNSINSTITRAINNRYLEKVEQKGQESLKITVKGRTKILKFLFNKKEPWDEQWRILIFDIPERRRKTRDAFRKMLAELGFQKYQISVWVCPFDRTEELEMIIEELNIKPFIQYFLVKAITNEEKLKENFKLR